LSILYVLFDLTDIEKTFFSPKKPGASRVVVVNSRSPAFIAFFYAGDRSEPPHVHVCRDDKAIKFCLGQVLLDVWYECFDA